LAALEIAQAAVAVATRQEQRSRVVSAWNGAVIMGGAVDDVDVEHHHLAGLQLDIDRSNLGCAARLFL
jgi:hypothetical protein